jgi:adenylyltransferase and sulfurtransferase
MHSSSINDESEVKEQLRIDVNDLIDHHSLDYKYEEEAQAAQHYTSIPGGDSLQEHNMSIQEQNLRLDQKLQDHVNIHVKDPSWEIDLQKKINELQERLEGTQLHHENERNELQNDLRQQELNHKRRLTQLEIQIHHLSEENSRLQAASQTLEAISPPLSERVEPIPKLSPAHIQRYSRQLLLQDGFGVVGQCKLLSSSVLVVGAGGIGSTALLYLAAAGIGRLSIIDFDKVDMSNLHRQIIHSEARVGVNKAVSACHSVKSLNPTIECVAVETALTHENALEIISRHDVIIDASDNPRTRYLINDACVLSGKPLISGSAMGTEGQLTVYNYAEGPCYRCLYPQPNAAEGCKSCSDNGVLGPVPGLIGVLQALEVIKVLTGVGTTMHDRMLMYDSLSCSFLSIKKPLKSRTCPICSQSASISSMQDSHNACDLVRGPYGLVDQGENFANHVASPIPSNLQISCQEYKAVRDLGTPHILLDVRVRRQYDMCSLEGAINIPIVSLSKSLKEIEAFGSKPIYCICRRGIFSMEATRVLSDAMVHGLKIHSVKNISGGLSIWATQVDTSFPAY